ncbi:retention module-containing protein [Aeromonas tecta]|uniref:retention module-containing protein n=1 Tax=Aeromonas tecta TaxID=324617 RepID=UPI0009F95687|nr:retention module-containing protein [Aeromonas tecta]
MAELRIEKPTLITQLEGTVFVMDAEGSLRRAAVGMQLQSGERLLAESNGRFELADSTDETHDPNQIMLAQADQGDALDPELASLQEAIRQGADPTALFEETAAGNDAAGTAGGVVGSSAGGFVVVDLNNDFTVVEAGFDTDHQTLPQGNEDPYVEDQDQVAEITITEPQTLDNIINADEATGVIIRGTVEDVEVGQTVTVTLTDQNGNSLTMTTVVLPGFVWEANFGDVTGKLVDGPLTIQADTQDAAGNRASDIGETLLDTITTITLDLADESDTGASQVDDLTRDTTPLLQGKGEPGATVTLSLGGAVLAVLTVDGNGNWQYQIPSDMADGAYDFRVDSVDIAGNRASDTLTVTVDTKASIDIDDLDTNKVLGHDNVTLSGTTTQVEAGQSVTITLIGQNGQTLYSGTALVGSDGRWQLSGLDLSTLSGPYEVRAEVTDLAGNRVIDGAPLIGQSDVLTLSEADLAKGPVSATGSLHTGAGLDGNLQVSFAADQSALEQLGLSSHGSALSYQINGQTLTASAGGITVFTLTLSNDGSYQIVWNQSLDHGQDNLNLPFSLEYRDSDGDLVHANLNVNLVDSTPPDFTLSPITLTEDAFTNQGVVVGQSHFVVGHQSDPLLADSVAFADQANTLARLNGSGLSSDGHVLSFEFSGDRLLTGYYIDDQGNRVEVIKAELNASQAGSDINGTVTVTLNGPLDHQGNDELSLGLSVSAKEIDGDETRADLVVSINDGVDPNLGIDSGISLQEGGASQSLDGQLPVNVGSDRLVSLNFEASQPGLEGLTSGGKATTYQVNGNQITLLDAGGKVILTVTLDLDGKYHLQLDGVLDQPLTSNSVNLGLQVQGTDFDGDQSNLGTLNIAITDGALPSVDAVTLDLVEDSDWSAGQSLSGDLNITVGSDPLANISFDANQPGLQGLTSGGQPVVISVSGNSISGTVNGQNIFTLTLDQQGHYVFTLNQPLDQGSADNLLKAGFTLTDSDGDKVSSSLSVAIGDGANPVISAVTGTEMTEANQGAKDVVSHMSFTVSHGSDALEQSSLKFDIAAIQQSLDGKYSSHGSPVTFTLDANGELVGTTADGREVLRAELELVDNNGNWSVTAKVTLSGELDHQGNESLDLPLTVTLTDKDGDSVSTDLPLVIKDGNAPGFVAGSGVSLDEGDLNGGNTLTGTGHFEVNAGSDRVSEVSFADISQQPKLTALGQSVIYELVDGDPSIPGNQILKGYVMVDGQRVEVLEVEISGSLDNAASNGFDYKVTLYEGVHQENGSTSTDLPFQINVIDSDKGAGNNDSTGGTLNVSIGEGNNPTISLTGVTLNEGRFDGAGSSQTADDQQATGKLTIKADSDPVVDVRLTLAGKVLDASGNPITHNGETLTWKEVPGSNGHIFQAMTASGTLVLTVTLPSVPGRIEAHTDATLDYQVTVHTNLDHGADNNLNLTLPVQVTDSDGSVINGNTNVVIKDAADPLISNIESVRVEEADLDASNTQHPGTTPTENGEAAGGKVTISAGSDRVASLELDVAAFNQANHLTSGGKEVTLAAHSNPGWYLASTADGKPVFWIHLDVNGSYSFHLVGQLDHGAQGKDELGIEIPLYVTDHDGDRSPNVTVEVHVQDDMPIGTSLAHTLNETGSSVNGDLLPPANEGADGARVVSVTVNGQVHAFNGSLTLDVMSPDGKQVMGSLTIGEDGNYSFTPRPGFDHDAASLSQVITAQIVDGDGDTAESTLTLNMEDEAVRFTVNAATGQEDQGAQDPSQGIPINMQLDIGDFDRGEHVDQLLIQAPANAHGTFYYNGVALTTTADGKWFIVPPAAMVTSDNVHYSTSGLTFVPADDWSSWSNNKQPLHFQVQVDVGVTEGTPPPPVTGDLAITVQGIADKPEWDSSTAKHYSINEDGNGVALNVQANLTDLDGSETLSYQIKWASGQGSLTLNGQELKPDANGVYTVSAGDINKITVVPGKDYSGDIKLSITPVSTEKTPVVSGQDKALGDSIELVINVNPQADDAKLTVREIQSKEDTLMNLGSKIVLAHLGDTADGSEQMFVRISGLPAGATLLLGGVAVVMDANGYYEVPYDRINELQMQPPKNSNVDFDLTIKGVVKDTATLTDANGQTHTVVNEKETGSQNLHVDMVGVVDEPHFNLDSTGWTPEGNGYSITIAEDGRAPLDFRLESGEKVDTPLDNSETLNLVLEGLPEGAKVFDGNGNELTLTFAGLDANGKPIYQVNVSDLGNLQIQPPPNSTADIHLVGHVVVTENDGDHKSFDVPLTIKVEPAIDAGDYAKTSNGLEDEFVTLNWHPDLSDSAEKVTHLSLSGIEPGYEIWVKDANGTHQLTLGSDGSVTLSDADLQSLLSGGQLLVRAPEDSDKDTNIQSHVTVTQHDVDSSVVVDKVINGNLHVDIQAVVEPDGNLVQTGGALESPDGHDIPLDGVFVFQDLDPSSVETIDYLVISDLPPGFVVIGGINDGYGNWTVPHDALGSYALRSPDGFTGTVTFKVSAQVHDLSDDGDVSASVRKDLNASADFHAATNSGQVAATVDLDNSQPITGVEDHSVNFGTQLKSMITLGTADIGDDELSIVLTGLPPGVSVQGLTYDFVNGEYLIKLPNGLSDLDNLTLTLPEDYAGDDLSLHVRLVNTDTVSGDTKTADQDIRLSITPEVDVNGGADGMPSLQLEVKDVNGDGQPDNLEDTEIHLDLSVKLADISPSVANGGLETVERVTVTVDAKYGHFLDANGNPVQSLVVDANGLKDLVFIPKEHYSGQVPLDVTVDILDTATTGTDRGSWSGQVGFEVKPVNDPAKIIVHDVKGDEDGRVNLGGFGAELVDTDGSEKIVGLQITGVPDGFTLSAPAVNNGNGVWQIPVGTDFSTLTLIPPADFSGSVDLTLTAYTLDNGLSVPLGTSGNFTVTVNPVGDVIIADIMDKTSGTEGDVITLNLGLETRDTQATGGSAGNVHENGPEQVRVTIEGVPDGAQIRLPNGVNGTVVDLGNGRWQVTTDGTKLGAIELVTNDANGALDLKVTAQSLDNGALGPEVNGTIHVDISPVNDAPINVLPTDPQVAQEDQPFVIKGLQVQDVDAGSGDMKVTLSVEHGTLNIPAGSGVTVVGNGTGSLVLSGSLDAINALLNGGLTYQGNPDYHGSDNLTMVTNDNGNTGSGGALSDTDVLPIEVQPVNDAPVNVLPSDPQVAQEDQPFVIHGLQVSDVDAGSSPLTVTLSVLHGTLNLVAGNGVTVTGNGTDSLVLSGSQDAINALLNGGVTYQGEQDFNGQDALTMVTNDNGSTGNGGAQSDTDVLPIEVEAVNDAPVNQAPDTMQVKEDGALSLSGISVKDVDAGSAPMSMVLRVEHGVLTLLGTMSGNVVATGTGTNEITLVGSLAELNALISGNLHYEPAKDFWGQDNLTIITSDQGNTGAGGALTDTSTVGITVTAEADDPQLSLGAHDIHALQGAWVPLNLSASVVNPAPGELSVRIQNLGGAQVVDEHGQSVGHADGSDWLLPMDQSVPIYLKDLPTGDHALILTAESSAGGNTQGSSQETLNIHSQSGNTLTGTDSADWLFGSSGDDRILGGQGNDILTGGEGSDLFVWGSGDEGTTGQPALDTITDFNPTQGDKLDLADLLQGVTDNSVDGLLNHLSASVTSGNGGLSDVNLSVSPAGDGQVTQQITLKDVDLSDWSLSIGSSSHDILQSLLDQNSLIIEHP